MGAYFLPPTSKKYYASFCFCCCRSNCFSVNNVYGKMSVPLVLLESWVAAYTLVANKTIQEETDFVLVLAMKPTEVEGINTATISHYNLADHEAMLPIPNFYFGQVITVNDAKIFIAKKALYNALK